MIGMTAALVRKYYAGSVENGECDMRRNRHLLLPLLILTFLCAQHVLAASTLQKPANVRWVTGKTATAAWDSVNGIDHYRVMIHVVHGIDPLGNREIHTKDTEIDLEKDILFIINSGYDSVQVTFDVAAVFDGTVYQYSDAVSSGSIEYYLKGDLNKAKDDAKAEVNGVDANSYVTSDRQTVTDSKETAINAIDAAKTEDEVRGAVETFFTAIQDCVPQAKADQDAANEVVAKINAIGTVAYTTASKGKIDAARTAYNGLSSAQKALVTNVNVLNAAETRYRELKAAAEAAAKKKAAEEAAKKKASLEKITIEKTPSSVKAKAKKNRKETFYAVRDVSFRVNDGEILGLLGKNGAGKTTLLRMLASVMEPSSGGVYIKTADGRHLNDSVSLKKEIGYLSGNTRLYHRISTREMLYMLGEIYELDRDVTEKRIDEICRVLDMSSFIDNRIERLSTGQTQRASIARCLIHDPSIYIFDEPTLGLDIVSADAIVDFMKGQKEKGKTVLYSTHYLEEAQFLCDRILMINEGRIVAEGTPAELMERTGTGNLREAFHMILV